MHLVPPSGGFLVFAKGTPPKQIPSSRSRSIGSKSGRSYSRLPLLPLRHRRRVMERTERDKRWPHYRSEKAALEELREAYYERGMDGLLESLAQMISHLEDA